MSERARYALACLEQGMSVQATAAAAGMASADVSAMRVLAGDVQRVSYAPPSYQPIMAQLATADDLTLRQIAATALGIIANRSGIIECDRILADVQCLTSRQGKTPRDRLIERISQMAESHGSSWREIVSRDQTARASHVRQEGYRMARDAGLSMPAIGKLFGGRDHTTVLSGLRAYEARSA